MVRRRAGNRAGWVITSLLLASCLGPDSHGAAGREERAGPAAAELDAVPVEDLAERADDALDERASSAESAEEAMQARHEVYAEYAASIERRGGEPAANLAAMIDLRARLFGNDEAELEFDAAMDERRERGEFLEPTAGDRARWVDVEARESLVGDLHERQSEELARSLEPHDVPPEEPDDVQERIRASIERHFEHPLPPGVLEACHAE